MDNNILKVPKFNRRITVGGKNYTWGAKLLNTGYSIQIRSDDYIGQLLKVENIPPLSQDMRWGNAEEEVEDMIEGIIKTALRHGWQPENPKLTDIFYL